MGRPRLFDKGSVVVSAKLSNADALKFNEIKKELGLSDADTLRHCINTTHAEIVEYPQAAAAVNAIEPQQEEVTESETGGEPQESKGVNAF